MCCFFDKQASEKYLYRNDLFFHEVYKIKRKEVKILDACDITHRLCKFTAIL